MSSFRIVNVQTMIALGGVVALGAAVFAFTVDSSLFGLTQEQPGEAEFTAAPVTDTNTVPVIAYAGDPQEGLEGWYADDSAVGDDIADANDWTAADDTGVDESGFGSDADVQGSSGAGSTVTNAARIE